MEGVVFVIALVISVFAAIWIYVGWWAVFLIIGLIIFGIFYLLKRDKNEQEEKDSSSIYFQKLKKIAELYSLVPLETLPSGSGLILSEQYIGILLWDSKLETGLGTFIGSYGSYRRDLAEMLLHEHIKEIFGDKGVEIYDSLGLQCKLAKGDIEKPIVCLPQYCESMIERDRYGKILKKWYTEKYSRELNLYYFEI